MLRPTTITLRPLLASTSRLTLSASSSSPRLFSTSSHVASDPKSPFNRPGPPPLPAKEQREFERLVKEKSNQSPFLDSSVRSSSADSEEALMHPDARRKPAPDFDGDTNPSTGEVGGPKKDPLTWEREWTYGGRATDF